MEEASKEPSTLTMLVAVITAEVISLALRMFVLVVALSLLGVPFTLLQALGGLLFLNLLSTYLPRSKK